MAIDIRRREFIFTLGGAAAAWPLAARAQQPGMPVVGFLRSGTLTDVPHYVTVFRQGLKEAGFVEGQNVAIESRSDEETDRLPLLVADLLRRQVALIVCNTPSTLAAKAATTTVPIVFVTGADPVRDGFVASVNRPGGNVTGISFLTVELAAKRLGLLRELRPGAARIAVLVDPFGHCAANRSPLRRQRPRNRDRLYNARPTWGWRAAHRSWRVLAHPTGTDCRASGPT